MTDKKIPFSDELIRQVAQQYGTPFHIYDEKGIHDNMKRLQKAFSWNPNFHEYFESNAKPLDHEEPQGTRRRCRLQLHGRAGAC